MRPPRPLDWAAAGAAEDWQMGNASAGAAMTAAGGAAEDGPGAAVEAEAAVGAMSPVPINWDTAVGVRPPRPVDWDTMTRVQKKK